MTIALEQSCQQSWNKCDKRVVSYNLNKSSIVTTLCTLPEYSLRDSEYVVTRVRWTEERHRVSSINAVSLWRKSASHDLSIWKSSAVNFISQIFTTWSALSITRSMIIWGISIPQFCRKHIKNIVCGKISVWFLAFCENGVGVM